MFLAGDVTSLGASNGLRIHAFRSPTTGKVIVILGAGLDAADVAMPGNGVLITREIAEQYREFVRRTLGVTVELVTDLKNTAGDPTKGYFRNGTIYLNLTDILEGRADYALLVDEWSHAWNDVHGRGKWIPQWKSDLDDILKDINRRGSSSRIPRSREYLFH